MVLLGRYDAAVRRTDRGGGASAHRVTASSAAAFSPDVRRSTALQPVRKERGAVTTSGNASQLPSKSMMQSSSTRAEDVEYAAALQKLRSLSPWTMTTARDGFGAYCVSFAIREYSGHVALRCWSKQQLTSLILLHVTHWEEMSSRLEGHERSDSQGSVSAEPCRMTDFVSYCKCHGWCL